MPVWPSSMLYDSAKMIAKPIRLIIVIEAPLVKTYGQPDQRQPRRRAQGA